MSLSRFLRRSRLPIEKRSDWAFELTDNGRWAWHVTDPDGTTESSEGSFLTLKECVAEATRCGYVAWIPEAERRNHRFSSQPASGLLHRRYVR